MDYKDSVKALEIEIEMELLGSVEECHTVIRSYRKVIVELTSRVAELHSEVKVLKERINTNSNNSSLPPSKSFKKKKKAKPPSQNQSGGQTGHQGHFRELQDSSAADKIVECKLPVTYECGRDKFDWRISTPPGLRTSRD